MTRELYRATTEEAKRAGRRWAIGITLGLGTVVVVNFAVWWLVRDVTFPLVRRDYYEHGLAYDREIAAGETNARLGLQLQPADGGVALLAYGNPVTPEHPLLHYWRPDRPELDFSTPALVSGTTILPVTAPAVRGRWRVTLEATWKQTPVTISTELWNDG
ncbi:MAG: hypothetical protein D6761_01110 [Candidatus Dadabacteria bacterium]|nr:MAG: hypothetical protein D6761_01110 [Candidatus Dadabacteria bacterium]